MSSIPETERVEVFRWPASLGPGTACLFAGFAWLGVAPANLALALLTAVLLVEYRAGRGTRPMASLLPPLLGLGGLLLVQAWALDRPPAGVDGLRAVRYAELWLVIPLAWGAALLPPARRLSWLLGLALAGFLLGRLLHLDGDQPLAFLRWRDGLGLPAIAFGEYCAAGLLILLLAVPEIVQFRARAWERCLLLAVWLFALAACAAGMIGSQSRGVWLALALVGPPAILLRAHWALRRASPRQRRRLLGFGLVVLMMLVGAGWWGGGGLVSQRLSVERETLVALVYGDLSADVGHDGSVGARVAMARLGLEWWRERPLLGWGPGAARRLLEERAPPELSGHSDLHNLYVQTLVELGLAGFALLAVLALIPLRCLWRAWRRRRVSDLYFLAVGAALALHALAALSNYRLFNSDWRFYWILFGGLALAAGLRRPPRAPSM